MHGSQMRRWIQLGREQTLTAALCRIVGNLWWDHSLRVLESTGVDSWVVRSHSTEIPFEDAVGVCFLQRHHSSEQQHPVHCKGTTWPAPREFIAVHLIWHLEKKNHSLKWHSRNHCLIQQQLRMFLPWSSCCRTENHKARKKKIYNQTKQVWNDTIAQDRSKSYRIFKMRFFSEDTVLQLQYWIAACLTKVFITYSQ